MRRRSSPRLDQRVDVVKVDPNEAGAETARRDARGAIPEADGLRVYARVASGRGHADQAVRFGLRHEETPSGNAKIALRWEWLEAVSNRHVEFNGPDYNSLVEYG